MSTTELLVEFVQTGSKLRIDRESGVIHGAKILGLTSKNGRRYSAAAVEKAKALYERAPVNVDHKDGPRSYADRVGQIHNVVNARDGLRADVHLNGGHPLTPAILWDAEHATEGIGLSHTIQGRISRERGGGVVVEEIKAVDSVDVVVNPATTRNLGESVGDGLHESTGGSAKKAALVATVAAEIGLPREAVPSLEGGLMYRQTEQEIRAYLTEHRRRLVEMGALVDRRQRLSTFDRIDGSNPDATADFLGAVTGNRPGGNRRFNESVADVPGEESQEQFRAAAGLPSSNGRARKFANGIS